MSSSGNLGQVDVYWYQPFVKSSDHLFTNLFGKDMKQHHEFHKVEILESVICGIWNLSHTVSQNVWNRWLPH